MNIVRLVRCLAVFLFLFCHCLQSNAQDTAATATPPSKVVVPLSSYHVPTGLSEFGTRSDGLIRVFIYGEVKQPGIYYLPSGTLVRDAIQSAGGLTHFATLSASWVLHPINAEQAEKIQFPRKAKLNDLSIPLNENDRLDINEVFD